MPILVVKRMHQHIISSKKKEVIQKHEYDLFTAFFWTPKITFKSCFEILVICVASIYIHKICMIQ